MVTSRLFSCGRRTQERQSKVRARCQEVPGRWICRWRVIRLCYGVNVVARVRAWASPGTDEAARRFLWPKARGLGEGRLEKENQEHRGC